MTDEDPDVEVEEEEIPDEHVSDPRDPNEENEE
jgi:hypothetical protein